MKTWFEVLKEARETMVTCKRNKSGSLNGNAMHAIKKRFAKQLEEMGHEDAMWQMHDLADQIK